MKKLALVLLSLLMLLGMAACSSGSSSAAPASSGEAPASSETPAEEGDGIFYFAVAGEPRLLDPAIIDDSVSGTVVSQIYYPFFTTDPDTNELVNQACVGYDVSEDGLVYTFHLDPNNKWSDGQPVTAEQYVYAWKRAIGMGKGTSLYSQYMADYVVNALPHSEAMDDVADMDDVGLKAVDDYTIEMTMNQPCEYFTSTMTMSVYLPVRPEIATEHDSQWANDISVPTNGAYKLTYLDAPTRFEFEKNEYFSHADQVKTQKLVGKVITDMDSQLMAFQTGEIAYANSLGNAVAKMYAGNPELVISKTPASYYLLMNSHNDDCPALQNRDVRRAIQLGIDRSVVTAALDNDVIYYELYGIVSKGIPGINGDFREEQDAEHQLVYTDKDEARALMEGAGYNENNKLHLVYYTNASDLHDTVAAVLREQLKDIYIDLEIKNAEIRTFFDDRENGIYEICRGGFSADYYDASTFTDLLKTTSTGEVVSTGNETCDQMIVASQALSGDERIQAMHEIEQYAIEEECFMVPVVGYVSYTLQSQDWNNISRGRFWYVEHK
ncbi:MAG: peptide ABC transporter substrate-binding protein [Erysipelotrichaceae bacterium]|nr:peptide ABC transporter substrate-binding protein [Erysipelotrichaceae bacterium]